MSQSNSTRESLVFTDWPPGPEERENRSVNSSSGTTTGPARTPSTLTPLPDDHDFSDSHDRDSPDISGHRSS